MTMGEVGVDEEILLQAVAALKYDAKRGYKGNSTTYADFRHGTARSLADNLDQGWKEIPDGRDGRDLE